MSGPGHSAFGGGRGLGGSADACTRRQNGVNTRKPPAVLVADIGGSHQQIAEKTMRAEADLGQRRRDLIGYRLMRAWAISFQNTAPACVSRASSAIIVAAGPLRSTSDEPLCSSPTGLRRRSERIPLIVIPGRE
jgi:hypothetical protein